VTFGRGDFPDGFAFDEEGGLWITSLITNRLMRFYGDRLEIVLEDISEGFVEEVEQAFAGGTMHAGHLGPIPGTRLQQLTSIAFGGRDARTAFLGSLHGACLYRFRTDIAGAPDRQWEFPAP
jgi:sugar lactone lactonase YvrE